MSEFDLTSVRDGGILRSLGDGLCIVRRRKHEWDADLERLSAAEFARATNPVFGSKFAATWSLLVQANWIEFQVRLLGWTRTMGYQTVTIELGERIGFSAGKEVSKIKIEMSSGFIHAYPIER